MFNSELKTCLEKAEIEIQDMFHTNCKFHKCKETMVEISSKMAEDCTLLRVDADKLCNGWESQDLKNYAGTGSRIQVYNIEYHYLQSYNYYNFYKCMVARSARILLVVLGLALG